MLPAKANEGVLKLHATRYGREKCDIGFVHLGYGAFHRAHQAVYIDDFMEVSGDLRWGIAAVNLRPSESAAFRSAQAAENGYLLKTMSPDGETKMRLVRSHCQFVDWSAEARKAEELLVLPSVHTITITVTESGYYLKNDWSLNVEDPVIAAEIGGEASSSVYAYLARALKRRIDAHGQPLNILCCDNIRSNGDMLRANFLSYLQHIGQMEVHRWVQDNVSFPCSMVDRITPRAHDDLKAEVATFFPDEFLNPIHAESFTQWVLEDKFKAPMPELGECGVQLVADVDPYEEAKIRILNGGHTGLCYLGALAGYETYDQAFNDPRLREIFDAFETDEVLPGLEIEVPFDKHAYLDEIAARFSNSAIADQLERICMDGYSKMPIYIRPTLEACLRQKIMPSNAITCVASWYVYARRFANGQMPVRYHEPYWAQLKPLLEPGREEVFARTKQLWANLPDDYPQFVSALVSAIHEVELKWPV